MEHGLDLHLYANVRKHLYNDNVNNKIPHVVIPTEPPPKGCGDPGTPANGLKTGSDYSIGAVVHYLCRPRFRLVGHPGRICQPNGQWSGSLPECVRQEGN